MVRPKLARPRGILRLDVGSSIPGHARYRPDEDLAPFVEHFWTVSWDVDAPEVREVLPHPSVHFVLERGRSRVVGVHTGRFTARLEGQGRVLAVKFKPGGFRPFIDHAVAELTDRTLPPRQVFDGDVAGLEAAALALAAPAAAFAVVQAFLRRWLPAPDPTVELVDRITRRAAEDREITRVEQLVDEFGIGLRTLQRLFQEYVGVSPKWVIRRYRLHEAVERIASRRKIDWATLALELGYADQAHFVRDFRKLIGQPPGQYARHS